MDRDSQLFMDLLRPHLRRLHGVARQYVTNESDAHELVQETLLRAWRNFAPTQDRVYRPAWFFTILRHLAWEWQRTASRRIRIEVTPDSELTQIASTDAGEPFAPLPAMDEARFREFLDDRLAAALDALEAPFREVIVLSVAGNLTYREISEVLDCPVGTVMSRVGRARRALRERLSAHAAAAGWLREGRR